MKRIFLPAILLLVFSHGLWGQCLTAPSCPTYIKNCGSDPNNAEYWNDPNFLDSTTTSHDLAEVPANLYQQLRDTCGSGSGAVHISYVLLLDLDGDSIRETAVSSDALPGANTVFFGNAANPNYSGGVAVPFDLRPVAAGEKYGFALQVSVQGNLLTGRVRWTNALAPNDYQQAKLPYGNHRIEWRFEKNGEVETCAYDIVVGYCPTVTTTINSCATYHCDGTPLPNVHYELVSTHLWMLPATYDLGDTGPNGCIAPYTVSIPAGSRLGFQPFYDGPWLEGVDELDLWKISRHILGLEPLGTPYKMIAADANKSGSITTFDIAELQKLILGEYAELPHNTSWRFVNTDFPFPNPNNPFQTAWPTDDTVQTNFTKNVYGIKVGDVDCSAVLFAGAYPVEYLSIPNLAVQAGDTILVPVGFAETEAREGFQFGLRFDPTKIQVLQAIPGVGNSSNLKVLADRVNAAWLTNSLPVTFPPSMPAYRLRVKALTATSLAEVFELDTTILHGEVFLPNEIRKRLLLQFATVATTEPPAAAQIFDPQPNPTNAGVRIPVSLERSTGLSIEILDLTGRLLYRQDQTLGAGNHQIEVPAAVFAQPGFYLWRVQTGDRYRSGKIVKQ